MTTMDSDSESQDSDDGRRFRFEATRKDATITREIESESNSSRRKSKHKSHLESRDYHERKDHSKRERSRTKSRASKDQDGNERHLKHTTKRSESMSHTHSESVHKEHRSTRDMSVTTEKNVTDFDGPEPKNRMQNSKCSRERSRDRSRHRKHRSERSRSKTRDSVSTTKHRSWCHERYKHQSQNKSYSRSSDDMRSDDKSQEEFSRHSSDKSPRSCNRSENLKEEHSTSRKSRQLYVDNGNHLDTLTDIIKTSLPENSKACKDIDLSDYDVLSEAEKDSSDTLDTKSQISSRTKRTLIKQDRKQKKFAEARPPENRPQLEERHKVNPNGGISSGSNNNNPSTVSDSLLGSVLPTTYGKDVNSEKESAKHQNTECVTASDKKKGGHNLEESFVAEDASVAYGPFLPSQFIIKPDDKQDLSRSDTDTKGTRRNFIGPILPPGSTLVTNIVPDDNTETENSKNSDDDTNFNMDRQTLEQETRMNGWRPSEEDTEDIAFGPALPPHLLKHSTTESEIIGPSLPCGIKSNDEDDCFGQSESDDEVGPLPKDHPGLRNNYIQEQLELRARRIKDSFKEEDHVTSTDREEWMTELPPLQTTSLGLVPRKFRSSAGPDLSDRSCWTDTPAKKAQKQRKREEEESNKELQQTHKKKHTVKETRKSEGEKESLLKMHQRNLQKQKKIKEDSNLEGIPVRRPFDRDIDLQINQLDQSKKKTIFMKAQALNDRFSRGEI